MPKLIRQPAALAAFVLAALAATPSGAIDPGNLNLITFQNRTGGDIRYIFMPLTHAHSTPWSRSSGSGRHGRPGPA
jgi:hypothetical protein